MAQPVIDHRGPEFENLRLDIQEKIRPIFQTSGPVLIYPSSGTGACEAALVNTVSPGEKVLICETGWFSHIAWRQVAEKLGILVDYLPGDWRHGASASEIEAKLKDDKDLSIRAIVVVHNETSTGITSQIGEIRRAINRAKHPALFIVDAISSIGSIDYRHDEWEVDVTVSGSQKGLMLPPGLGFNAISEKARAAAKNAKAPKSYWDWQEMFKLNSQGSFVYTPATNLLYALQEALIMLEEEGLKNVFQRHKRHADATRAAVQAWGLENVCQDPIEYSDVLTAILMPEGSDADLFRKIVLENFDMSLGAGLGQLTGKVFRIGHLGSFNDLMLAGTLSGVEMGLRVAGVPHSQGGVMAALNVLAPA
jgi:alanine-glyoxylate transaminase/serine-glyoxylate transaminase/serine-pyruvate transaminase